MAACLLMAGVTTVAAQQAEPCVWTVDARWTVTDVAPTMYGVFFEDINFGADGGLYAELVNNRSFEAPLNISLPGGRQSLHGLQGWKTYGDVTIDTVRPAFSRNPHYAVLRHPGHGNKKTGLENHGYFGMGVKADAQYDFSAWVRCHGGQAKLRIELMSGSNDVLSSETVTMTGSGWQRLTAALKSKKTDAKAFLRIYLQSEEGIDMDHVSLFPADNWHGLRPDLVQDLADLHPGIFRFPGGCIVEGADTLTRYQWKNTVGPAENRPLNENRWNYSFSHRQFADYYQSLGMGFYEYFLLAEHIGAAPLPILNCGMACQYQNKADDASAVVALSELQPYIDDALDLIEFANGPADSRWGALRAEMGHSEPFGLKYIGIGNEQWGAQYPERLALFVKAIRQRYPDVQIVGSSGPKSDGEWFDDGWREMRRLGVDLVDEHYYKSPEWFLQHAGRYDGYPRRGPKVFAGEYAAHPKSRHNNFEGALAEAAFMTGLERNADVVRMATYAPLFAHAEGWQWRPDLIWFDNLRSVRSVNWYVQQLYSIYKGTHVVALTADGQPVEGADGLYASAVYDQPQGCYYVKIVNASAASRQVQLAFKGIRRLVAGSVTTLHADDSDAQNTLEHPAAVIPQTQPLTVGERTVSVEIGQRTFAVVRLRTR